MKGSTSKFILSPYCKIVSPDRIKLEKISDPIIKEKVIAKEIAILEDDHTWHLINPTIKYFLQLFNHPTSLSEATLAMASAAGCDKRDIEDVANTFFEDMCRLRLLEKTRPNKITSKTTYSTLTKKTIKGRYQLKDKIFSRRNVEIYIAHDNQSSDEKIIKLYRLNDLESSVRINRIKEFQQEFKLHAEIPHHPNICQFYEFGVEDQISYAVLEKLNNLSFRKLFKQQDTLYNDKKRLMTGVVDAIAHIHQHGILHGDIHLSNFLIQENFHIKLIDFNLSNRVTLDSNEKIRQGGVFQYIAPEKINTSAFEMVNNRADYTSEVWQMGIVLYFIFYEKMPFDDFTWHELASSIQNKSPDYPDHTPYQETIEKDTIEIIQACLNKDKTKRPSSAVEVANMLARAKS